MIGLSVLADKASSANVRPAFGILFERLLNKHNSAEIGIYYRSTINDNLIVYTPDPGGNFVVSEQFFILEKFISIPLLYNYRSKTLNISIGPSVDIYAGWKEKKHVINPPAATVPLQTYGFDNKLLWGAIAKISKTFKVNSKILIEPTVYVNPIFTPYSLYSEGYSETRQYYGAAFTAKYVL
ncbi:MAG: hypothetical protein ACHQFX_05435 [Chitinophagales bacterium]